MDPSSLTPTNSGAADSDQHSLKIVIFVSVFLLSVASVVFVLCRHRKFRQDIATLDAEIQDIENQANEKTALIAKESNSNGGNNAIVTSFSATKQAVEVPVEKSPRKPSSDRALKETQRIASAKKEAAAKREAEFETKKNNENGLLILKICGERLKNTEGFFKKPDPFYEIHKMNPDKRDSRGDPTWDCVYQSDFIANELSPVWKEETLGIETLCGGDMDLPLQFRLYDYEKSGKHKYMGQFQASINELIANQSKSFQVHRKTKKAGKIMVIKVELHQ